MKGGSHVGGYQNEEKYQEIYPKGCGRRETPGGTESSHVCPYILGDKGMGIYYCQRR
jgi:hypothetical protein